MNGPSTYTHYNHPIHSSTDPSAAMPRSPEICNRGLSCNRPSFCAGRALTLKSGIGMCGPEDPLFMPPVVRKGPISSKRSLKSVHKTNFEILASTASSFTQILALMPISVHKTSLSETKISSQPPPPHHFRNLGRSGVTGGGRGQSSPRLCAGNFCLPTGKKEARRKVKMEHKIRKI